MKRRSSCGSGLRPLSSVCQESGCVLARERGLDRVGEDREGVVELGALGLAELDALGREIERIEEAAQARVRRQRADQRLRRDELVGEACTSSFDRNSMPFSLEEIAAVGPRARSGRAALSALSLASSAAGGVLGLVGGLRRR